MYISIEGFLPPDERFVKMKKIRQLCKELGIIEPGEVRSYYQSDAVLYRHLQDDNKIDGKRVNLQDTDCCTRIHYVGDCQDTYKIDVTKLPTGVKTICFYAD